MANPLKPKEINLSEDPEFEAEFIDAVRHSPAENLGAVHDPGIIPPALDIAGTLTYQAIMSIVPAGTDPKSDFFVSHSEKHSRSILGSRLGNPCCKCGLRLWVAPSAPPLKDEVFICSDCLTQALEAQNAKR